MRPGMATHNRVVRLTLISQICLYGLFLLCVCLMPHFLFEKDEGGASNFGLYARTIIPYSLAFLLSAGFLFSAAQALPKHVPQQQALTRTMRCIAALLICVLLSTYPYKVNNLLDGIHVVAALALILSEFIAGIWFVQLTKDAASLVLFSLQVLGILLSLLTTLGVLHILFLSQIVSGVAFGWLFVRTVSSVMKKSNTTATA